jgi:hypothetical protein
LYQKVNNLSSVHKELIAIFDRLSAADQANVQAYAEFLASRSEQTESEISLVSPKDIPRPEEETVVAAIRRLTDTYDMLERRLLLDETSTLMSAHILQGEEAVVVIDKLESLFASHYEQYQQKLEK